MQVLVISFAIAMKDHTSDFLNKLINTNTTEMIIVLSADKNQYTLFLDNLPNLLLVFLCRFSCRCTGLFYVKVVKRILDKIKGSVLVSCFDLGGSSTRKLE